MMEEIRMLTALEAVRCRPGMFVMPDSAGSVPDQLLRASLCHPMAELSCGSASHLAVTVNGLSATVADDGSGWPVHPLAGGRRFAETLLSEMYACRDHKQHADLARSLCRITLPVVVALSEMFTLDIRREGEHWQQVYRNGIAGGPLSVVGPCGVSGTTLSFCLDPQFCEGAILSAPAFMAWLTTLPPEIPTSPITLHHP